MKNRICINNINITNTTLDRDISHWDAELIINLRNDYFSIPNDH